MDIWIRKTNQKNASKKIILFYFFDCVPYKEETKDNHDYIKKSY